MSNMQRALAKIDAPQWDGLDRPALRDAIRGGYFTYDDACILDTYLAIDRNGCETRTHRDRYESFANQYSFPYVVLTHLKRVLLKLTQDKTAIRELDQLIHEAGELAKPPKTRPPKRRARKFSVYPEELPQKWQQALARINADLPGADHRVVVESMRKSIETKLCECAKVARDTGLEPALSVELLSAYEASLHRRERPLTPMTITSAIRRLRSFASYIGAEEDVIAHLKARVRFNENQTTTSTPLKEERIRKLPSFQGIFEMAFDRLGRADLETNPRIAQSLRNTALAITLFSAIPLRVGDSQLKFDEQLLWTGEQYYLKLRTSKSNYPVHAPILGPFQYFIDKVVLDGYPPEYLEEKREKCLDMRRNLFVKHNGKVPHPGYTSFLWREAFGTGQHAARMHLHDEFADLGARGVQMAMCACGQRSNRTAEFYRSEAYDFCATRRVQETINQFISDADWKRYCRVLDDLT